MTLSHDQTFSGGMKQDIDPHIQAANTYRHARNMRLLFNQRADTEDGRSLALTNTPGNKLTLSLPAGSYILGGAECTLGTVLFVRRGTVSIIGLWLFDTIDLFTETIIAGPYKEIYRDDLDPHLPNVSNRRRISTDGTHDRLDFRVSDEISDLHSTAAVKVEDSKKERLYWTTGRDMTHVLNLTTGNAGVAVLSDGYYPSWWSAHAFRGQRSVATPRILLYGRCIGHLPSGAYQVAIQYRGKDGDQSLILGLTRRAFVTDQAIDDPDPTRQQALRANHHNRTMYVSGRLTNEGLRWHFDGVDVRWHEYRLCVAYFEAEVSASLYYATDWKPITGPQVTVDLTRGQANTTLAASDFNAIQSVMEKEASIVQHDNRLFAADVVYANLPTLSASTIRVDPVLSPMRVDDSNTVANRKPVAPSFRNVDNPITTRKDGDPLTNRAVVDQGNLTFSAFTGQTVTIPIVADYLNYKGQVYEWRNKGYFRSETYELGIVAHGLTGQTGFVTPIDPITMPDAWKAGWELTKGRPGTEITPGNFTEYYMQVLTLLVSGVRIAVSDLYDDQGRLRISGFSIVRQKRRGRVAHQGVMMPAMVNLVDQNKLFPLPASSNFFDDLSGNAGERPLYFYAPMASGDDESVGGVCTGLPGYLFYHSPDLMIEGKVAPPLPTDRLIHSGIVGPGAGTGRLIFTRFADANRHYYVKTYRTDHNFPRINALVQKGRPALGSGSRVKLTLAHDKGFDDVYKEFDPDYLKRELHTNAHVPYTNTPGVVGNPGKIKRMDSLLTKGAVLMKASDYSLIDISDDIDPALGGQEPYGQTAYYRMGTYTVQPTEDTTNRPYISTGHFQPINPDVLAQAKPIYENGELTHYEFNDIDVAGGDCMVGLFDFTRLYPFWSDGCDKGDDSGVDYPDYSVSHILPIESKYNLALLYGRKFASSAIKPEKAACTGDVPQYSNGIHSGQPEDFNYNRVLLLEEATQFYSVMPPDTRIVTEQPAGFVWSPEASAGQLLDNWRTRLVGDAGLVDGAMGRITALVKSDFEGLYVVQEKGFGVAPINPATYQNTIAGNIVINSGAFFRKVIYISRQYGTGQRSSLWQSNGQIGFWDARKGVLVRHTQAGLDLISRTENLSDLISTFTLNLSTTGLSQSPQVASAMCAVDEETAEVLLCLRSGRTDEAKHTFVYLPLLSTFAEETDNRPSRYIRRGRALFTVGSRDTNKLYRHNAGARGEWEGSVFDSSVTLIVNPAASQEKTFDNGLLNTSGDAAGAIKKLLHQTSDKDLNRQHIIHPGLDKMVKYTDSAISWPMYEDNWGVTKPRLRDHYMILTITIDNTKNIPVSLTSMRTYYRPSMR
jgi:hypothetical protein